MSQALGGLRPWLLQRLTAAYLAGFVGYALVALAAAPPQSLEAWRAWVLAPARAVATALFFLALLAHAWVGVRDVVLDYVRAPGVRVAVLAALALALLAQGLWVVRILAVVPR
jgi:succinate dehydrogenase / fumarate reductase membrane anchor subunit